ncbi:MAG: hypothetical protein A2X19_10660 [Bacteroidetes bacterium GWE2_39_28]|nr:MAG: hypothetical protein A2X19_10660 [Bacteroidetes bacterium GWE2_39_28]OFY13541.1 MAG: hypothetical protein A2X16_07720 [Bacteroidetes bacterium GWF2_39_10]OFZ06646.1 MAG: hypothetical protein A2322_02140 [Bacteroidetes bacterium RIFOXYB2_FULL_39_7]OFZ11700.1 MAG: hypothetical protein A2465_05725 [Bacteroidetes bacterium RIFOXYC2_FULL_39_11]HCT94875.1 molecular chaperone [Rikenellaceae bacterium]
MFKTTTKFVIFVVISSILSIFYNTGANAQGNLLITPRRIVFDGTRRVMELNLANTGVDTARYNISLLHYRMNEDGTFTEITEPDPGQNFADKNIRFFPRSVTLGPNEAQSVRMQVTNQDRLAPGEYRSHVYFRSVPNLIALGDEAQTADSTSVSVQLIPIFGITIPVIIRIGENNTKVNLSDISLNNSGDTTNIIEFRINRTGNMSVYGDIKVTYISNTGKETQIGALNGVAVYTPNAFRRVLIELNGDKSVDYKNGKLKITYSAQSETRPEIYGEAEYDLTP